MASIRLKRIKKDGSKVFEIRAARQRGQAQKSMSWTAPAGWSQKSVDRELAKIAADLDRGVKSGEILTRPEQKEKDQTAAEEEAKIKTIQQYGDSVYIPYKQTECAARTVEYYQSTLRLYIYPAIGNKKIVDVRAVDLKKIITDAQTKGLGFSTVRGIYLTLAQMFDQANKDDVIEVNPMTKVRTPRRKKDDQKKEIEAFTAEQLDLLCECLEHEPLKWRTFFHFLMDTGVRKGEACGLRWDAIDFESGWVTIATNVINTSEDGKLVVQVVTPKTGKTRRVRVSASTLQLLREMKLQTGRFDYVFVQVRMTVDHKAINEPMSPQSADHYLRTFTKKYGIDFKCNPHKFRHTAATTAIRNGAPIPAVSRMLGHAQISTTMDFYVHPDDKDVEEACEILQAAIHRA